MSTPNKPLSLWTHFCNLIKYFSTFIISNKHATEPHLDNDRLSNASVDCENLQSLPSFSHNIHDQIFITDSDEMYQWASKDTYLFRLFKFLQKFKCLQFFLDGTVTINPCWQSVLKLDEVLNENEPIEITDTLILHCETIEKYDRIIPRIRGSYNRLILYGHTTWHQIKQLYHPSVMQYRINATFEISPSEHDEFVNFVKEHCRGWSYKFSIADDAKCPLDLLNKLKNAFPFCGGHDFKRSAGSNDFIYSLRIFTCWILYNIFLAGPMFILLGLSDFLKGKPDVQGYVVPTVMPILFYYPAFIAYILSPPMDMKSGAYLVER